MKKINIIRSHIHRIKAILKQPNLFDLNNIYYIYRRNRYLFDINRLIKNYKDVEINHPIFLLGTQGNGNTLISRIIRRHQNIVSVTGNYRYWAGADEMNSVLGPILPVEFKSIEYIKPYFDTIKYPTDWVCGIDKYYNFFRKDERDYTPELGEKFKHIIRWIISKNGVSSNPRFIDKSQTFTLKMPLLEKIFQNSKPKFILITRNPYVSCYRAASGRTYKEKNYGQKLSFNEKLELACQHWKNYISTAVQDGQRVENFMLIRFEDVIRSTDDEMKNVCDFININYTKEMLPQKGDLVPFGSRRRDRWYPLRSDVNLKHLSKIKKTQIELITNRCGELATYLGYSP